MLSSFEGGFTLLELLYDFKISFFKALEYFHELFWLRKQYFLIIVIFWDIDEILLKQVVKSLFPISISHLPGRNTHALLFGLLCFIHGAFL